MCVGSELNQADTLAICVQAVGLGIYRHNGLVLQNFCQAFQIVRMCNDFWKDTVRHCELL